MNDFVAFGDDARTRIDPSEIRANGRVPTNASIFFTIFQTFMSGPNDSPHFGQYPPDFFDLIIIDECHRGGANDESTWRAILEYFSPAVQIGLTATPKRDQNVDTYDYFGEPVYIYSLKDGIADGFLTPFKVRRIWTTLDEYRYVPDDEVLAAFIRRCELSLEEEQYRVRDVSIGYVVSGDMDWATTVHTKIVGNMRDAALAEQGRREVERGAVH